MLKLKENDFTHMIYVAEAGACKICGPLDRKAIPIDEVEKGVNMFPMHPNCRCSAYGHIDMKYKAGGGTLDHEATNGVWSDKSLEKENDKEYNQGMETSQSIAKTVLGTISQVEPEITSALSSVVKSTNGKLAGLDFRLKSVDSLARKIESDALLDDISLQEAASQINDVLRYTTIFELEDFRKNYDEMRNKLIASGFEIKKVKNTWLEDGPYKGVNTILEKDGLSFEMQYHTQESFDLKNGRLHELYEERRLSKTSLERKVRLDQEMIELSRGLTAPNGIEGVK